MSHPTRRVPVHKDEWVTECTLLRVDNTRLQNQVDQLQLELKRGEPEKEKELRWVNKMLGEQLADMMDKSEYWRGKVVRTRIAFWVCFVVLCLVIGWLIGGTK
ncbi:MAG: hypothetical protein ACOYOU_16375 [Kiritimatiellia bacterium]